MFVFYLVLSCFGNISQKLQLKSPNVCTVCFNWLWTVLKMAELFSFSDFELVSDLELGQDTLIWLIKGSFHILPTNLIVFSLV